MPSAPLIERVVTVLASVFVPISLASSIFGMNVQEINESGHSVWSFALCAILLWLLTGAVWMAWQARRNYKVATHRVLSSDDTRDLWHDSGPKARKRLIHEEYPGWHIGAVTRLLYLFGFRRLEKFGQTAV